MSAYGALSRPTRSSNLPTTAWPHPRDPHATVTIFHIDSSTLVRSDGLFEHLHAVFADEVDKGLTYPQEDMRDPGAFRAYFFAADVVIAILTAGGSGNETSGIASDPPSRPHPHPLVEPVARGDGDGDAVEIEVDLKTARAERSWDDCVVGFYYVKPNYPGRSSHVSLHRYHKEIVRGSFITICNAGFVVPPSHRGGGYGRVLARSYLFYAPRLGYEASVFNLVYVNNVASVRLWEKLGFVKAGMIPRAGRLRRMDGLGEEYVDAWVFYKRFR